MSEVSSSEATFWGVGFLDFMGQSERLLQVHEEVTSNGVTPELKAKISQTFGRVIKFRKVTEDLVAQLTQPMRYPDFLKTKITKDHFDAITSRKIGVEFHGDAVFLKVCLKIGLPLPPLSIQTMMETIGIIYLTYLSVGIPVRGAIEVGWGWEINTNSLYGSMIPRVVQLEENKADFPRILIGDEFRKYLDVAETQFPKQYPGAKELSQMMVQRAKSFIVKDSDNEYALNPFNPKQYVNAPMEMTQAIANAKNFAESSLKEFQESGNDALRKKYQRLSDFIARNSGN